MVLLRRNGARRGLPCTFLAVVAVLATACAEPRRQDLGEAPAAAFVGPGYLYGTVGSLARVRSGDDQPLLASSWGLVANLPGTGSISAPAHMRQWYLNRLRKGGFGRSTLGTSHLSAAKVLADRSTAPVKVEGLIPPGAIKGTRFDVLVSALTEDRATTNLGGGVLYTAELGLGGANPGMLFTRPVATARGRLHVDAEATAGAADEVFRRRAVVIGGGKVTTARRITLLLNQTSWTRSDLIADRINERFPAGRQDKRPTANAIDDTRIQLAIPTRFASSSGHFLALIGHLFLQRGGDFDQIKAQELTDLLAVGGAEPASVALAHEALGNKVLPIVRRGYEHENPVVRMAALEAGSRLQDETAVRSLVAMSEGSDPTIRSRCAAMLVHLPRSRRASDALFRLLDDPDQRVRLTAYESLARMSDPRLGRQVVGDGRNVKFMLDLIPAKRPLVYVVQDEMPRIAVFNTRLPFETPLMARLWDNRLMLKAGGPGEVIDVFYQPPGAEARTIQIAPTLANLILLMGHRPNAQRPHEGLDLTYSQVVAAVQSLCDARHVNAPVVVRRSALVTAVQEYRQRQPGLQRPTTLGPDLGPDLEPQLGPELPTDEAVPRADQGDPALEWLSQPDNNSQS